ncbi:endoplasmic reticulum-Golgi intermediate compartment protein 2 [Chanos chanos]|uniref:Endoplasmic reticulum-Golgi intermediate compartment protein n=1 Tax=Chanos chanos TaxID=29144 RepID=A0A6J2VG96_CHACN|nr:endoplasmic reticulum-Golgi intermediate compartment protein 2-like [Chanos chanos]
MRRLNRKKAVNLVKELDAFPKVPESCVKTSAVGGTVSLIVFVAMATLTLFEFFVYQDTWVKYEYEVDKDFSSKLRINIDITVAMKCNRIGADVLDRSHTTVVSEGLQYEPAAFELSPQQALWQQSVVHVQGRLKEEHSLGSVLFRHALQGRPADPLPNKSAPVSGNACRIHGHLYVNKVAGNFHITLGKPLSNSRHHTHIAALYKNEVQNFSHRIEHLSFGEGGREIINPLDATEKITTQENHLFQYFVTVVPTKLHTSQQSVDTHQYSVTERERVINHTTGRHGLAGIFVRYKLSALMVRVSEQHMPMSVFLTRLCGIIGGLFSTSDLLHRLVGFFVDIVCCYFKVGSYKYKEGAPEVMVSCVSTSFPQE